MATNRNRNRILAALLLFVLVTAASFFVGRLTGRDSGETSPAQTLEATRDSESSGREESKEREVAYWRAPMNPSEVYTRPGKSRMGMDLVPVYSDEAGMGPEGVVTVNSATIQNIGVRTKSVEKIPLHSSVRTTGRFESNERNWTSVSLKVGGWIEKLYVDFEGARVREGQPLFDLYSPELVSTQEEYLLAFDNASRARTEAGRLDAERVLQAAKRRLGYWDISDDQIARLEATGEPEKTLTLHAQSSGTVITKSISEGQRVAPGQTLLEIADLSNVWLMVDVYEQDLVWVTVGTQAAIELQYDQGKKYTGRVDYIYDTLDPRTRIVKARVTMPNPGLDLKPGMYATVVLDGDDMPPTLVVPEEAVMRTGEETLVIVALGEGRFLPRKVQTGIQSEGNVQILEGLQEGEEIVTSAQFLLDSEARLKSAIGALIGGENPDPTSVMPDSTVSADQMDVMTPALQETPSLSH